jgi:hypothetical protein
MGAKPNIILDSSQSSISAASSKAAAGSQHKEHEKLYSNIAGCK